MYLYLSLEYRFHQYAFVSIRKKKGKKQLK